MIVMIRASCDGRGSNVQSSEGFSWGRAVRQIQAGWQQRGWRATLSGSLNQPKRHHLAEAIGGKITEFLLDQLSEF